MKKFKDFAEEEDKNLCRFEGAKIKVIDVINKTVNIIGFRVLASMKKAGSISMRINLMLENKPRVLFTSSPELYNLLSKYNKELPFQAKIIQENGILALE